MRVDGVSRSREAGNEVLVLRAEGKIIVLEVEAR